MLVLTRKQGETIFIGEDIRIVLVELQGSQARIGISCPECLTVMRAELGTRTKKFKWPNCTPDEMVYIQHRFEQLSEWWTLPNAADRKREHKDLDLFLYQLQRWALREFMERYALWYKEE